MNRWNNLPDLSKWFIISHYSDITVPKEKFENFTNLTWVEIQRLAYSIGLRRRRYVALDENYFDAIDTEAKAYFLGLLWADGNNCEYKRKKKVQISLQEGDKRILEIFKRELKFTGVLSFKSGRMSKGYKKLSKGQYYIQIYNDKLYDTLYAHGMISNKTLFLKFPTCVPDNLMNHFIRGYFDGDGCIYIKDGTTQCSFNICGTKDMVEKIGSVLQTNCTLNPLRIRESKNLFLLDWGGIHQLRRIQEYLYKDATIYLERKYNKFQQLI